MRNPRLNQRLIQVRALIDRTGAATQDIELQKHWGRYLCVVVAGFLEVGIQTVYSEFARQSASEPVATYVLDRLERVRNPNARRFVDVARSFSPLWGEQLEEFLGDGAESRKDAIDSIMRIRNQIAHGGTVGITVHSVRNHLDRAVQVLEFIEDQCDGRA